MTTTNLGTEADTRDRLIDGAVGLLHSNGYRAVGVKALCEAAGVRRGSFYHFFASKEDLTLAALERSWDLFRTGVIEPALADHTDPDERNRTIREACLAATARPSEDGRPPHGCIFGRLAASITEDQPLLRARLADVFTDWAALLGDGADGWNALAGILGHLVLGFTVEVEEVSGT